MAETLISSCVQGIPSTLSKSWPRIRCTPATVKVSVSGRPEQLGFRARSIAMGRRRLRLLASAIASVEVEDDESMSIHSLRLFFALNIGKWNGSFYQFDAHGNMLQSVITKLSVSSYGEDDLISLIQSLYIKQPLSSTLIVGHNSEAEWLEYKIKETNIFTVDKYQQKKHSLLDIKLLECWKLY
ncbi:hypothetical protein HPP92_015897 [Vanilla planifolia]|uniref:DUF3598 domain-containing protein n=1 Tax=Vanilla planifolia TaxID=51239 RepID=A0A835UVJ1_VANPL|nr:hypothetical protein HPP92_015897 [Vanilla planifolia]